jgi:hypothetical protein
MSRRIPGFGTYEATSQSRVLVLFPGQKSCVHEVVEFYGSSRIDASGCVVAYGSLWIRVIDRNAMKSAGRSTHGITHEFALLGQELTCQTVEGLGFPCSRWCRGRELTFGAILSSVVNSGSVVVVVLLIRIFTTIADIGLGVLASIRMRRS